MEQYLSQPELEFRETVRAFLREQVPPSLAARVRATHHLERDDLVAWQQALFKRGWAAPSWPVEFGGTGWSPMQRYIFEEECAWADAPRPSPFGIAMIGPVLYTYGTSRQKERYLPRILAGDETWCQGYSEPGAGSDLAALRTRATRCGDSYVVSGSKIWTSMAHFADMMFCLVRTDPEAKAQSGISFLLIDMTSPGIEIRPIISIDGAHSLNEVFFNDVKVPLENLVGEENRGWTYAKFLLGHERVSQADVAPSKKRLSVLKEIARAEPSKDTTLLDDWEFSGRISALEIELMALEVTGYRYLLDEKAVAQSPASSSMLKLRGSEILQALTELSVEAMAYKALPFGLRSDGSRGSADMSPHTIGRVEDYLFRRAATIYAGSSETQRNIIAKVIFGS